MSLQSMPPEIIICIVDHISNMEDDVRPGSSRDTATPMRRVPMLLLMTWINRGIRQLVRGTPTLWASRALCCQQQIHWMAELWGDDIPLRLESKRPIRATALENVANLLGRASHVAITVPPSFHSSGSDSKESSISLLCSALQRAHGLKMLEIAMTGECPPRNSEAWPPRVCLPNLIKAQLTDCPLLPSGAALCVLRLYSPQGSWSISMAILLDVLSSCPALQHLVLSDILHLGSLRDEILKLPVSPPTLGSLRCLSYAGNGLSAISILFASIDAPLQQVNVDLRRPDFDIHCRVSDLRIRICMHTIMHRSHPQTRELLSQCLQALESGDDTVVQERLTEHNGTLEMFSVLGWEIKPPVAYSEHVDITLVHAACLAHMFAPPSFGSSVPYTKFTLRTRTPGSGSESACSLTNVVTYLLERQLSYLAARQIRTLVVNQRSWTPPDVSAWTRILTPVSSLEHIAIKANMTLSSAQALSVVINIGQVLPHLVSVSGLSDAVSVSVPERADTFLEGYQTDLRQNKRLSLTV